MGGRGGSKSNFRSFPIYAISNKVEECRRGGLDIYHQNEVMFLGGENANPVTIHVYFGCFFRCMGSTSVDVFQFDCSSAEVEIIAFDY